MGAVKLPSGSSPRPAGAAALQAHRYPVSQGWPEMDISATAVWVRAAGADISRFGEARPIPLGSLPLMTDAVRP